MKKVLCLLVLAAACKTDGAESTPAPSADKGAVAEPSANGPKPRSGKIDPGPRLPRAPGDPQQLGEGNVRERPDWGNMTEEEREERRKVREERREERRKERMELLDTNKDGNISPEEMQAGRKQRAEDMRERFDANGDGKLTVQELSEGRMGRRMDPAAADTNKDGELSAEELQQSMDSMRERFRSQRGERQLGGSGAGSSQP